MRDHPLKCCGHRTVLDRAVSVVLVLISLSSFLLAQAPQTLAVLEFDAFGISQNEARTLTDRLRNNIAQAGAYRLVDRGAMEEVLQEQGFQQTGCTSDECIVEVGKLLGVQLMLGGSIGKVGRTFTVSMRIIDVETAGIVKTASYDMTGEVDELLTEGMREAAALILGLKEAAAPPAMALATLNVSSIPAEARVLVDGEEKGATPLQIDQLRPNRNYAIEVSKPDYYSVDTTVALAAGSFEDLRFTLRHHQGWLSVAGFPEGAGVFVGKERIGVIPLSRLEHPTGTYQLTAKKPGFLPHRENIEILLDQETALDFRLQPKSKGRAFLFSTLLPGSGQLYQGYSVRGLLFLAAGVATGFLAQQAYAGFTESQQQYEKDLDAYNSMHQGSPIDFMERKRAVNNSFRKMKDDENRFLMMAGALGAVWTINLVEVIF
ncbi:MAG: PEGA domain-containing protein [Fidelibacterota bacterium]